MDRKEILEKINRVKYWRHRIDLGNGIFTPGTENPKAFDYLGLPKDLSGKTVLDIGAWDGLYSFEAERRGAKVLATDLWHDEKLGKKFLWDDIRNGVEGFLTARDILDSKVEHKNISVYDISPETVGDFDIVLFLGVLYHLPDPILALKTVASVTKQVLIVESQLVKTKTENIPLMTYYSYLPTYEVQQWNPNLLCLKKLILDAGLKNIEVSISVGLRIFPLRQGYIKNSNTHLYAEPNTSSIIRVLNMGQRVAVTGTADGESKINEIEKECWYRIETQIDRQKIQGWVRGVSLQPIRGLLKIKSLIHHAKSRIQAELRGDHQKYSRAIVKGYK